MSYHLFAQEFERGHAGDLAQPGIPAPIVLRDYQRKALAAILAAHDRQLHRVMVVMPTGTGKTTLFASLIDEFDRQYGQRSLVVAHRQELLQQAADRIRGMAPRLTVGIEGGDDTAGPECQVVVAGVQSIGRPNTPRLGWFSPGLLIMDEGHHAPADTWQNVMRRFGSYSGDCFTLAVTATDHRMDNRPLHGSEAAIFEDVVFRYSLRQAVADGWLVDIRGFRVATTVDLSHVKTTRGDYSVAELARAVNIEERNATAFLHWRQIAEDRRTIVFCVDVEHAKSVALMFREHGFAAEHVDGTMNRELRERIMRDFRTGRIQVLVNVEVATEGYDAPEANCVLMLRPTQSWALYTQMAGRGVRTLPGTVDGVADAEARLAAIRASGKPDCFVIDIVDVSEQFSLSGPPTDEEEDGKKRKPYPASAAGLVGLPADFDLQGHSIFEAADWADELGPRQRAEMFRRSLSFDDLSTVLSEVDLLRELSIPEEILGVSRLAWMKIGRDEYLLPCGRDRFEGERTARITIDELGRYWLRLATEHTDFGLVQLGQELQHSFDTADQLIQMTFPDCGQIVRANAGWREEAPTAQQLESLRRLGADPDSISQVKNRGQARAMIEQLKLGRLRPRRVGR
jgi:superfamily II DNA or RNA helicase